MVRIALQRLCTVTGFILTACLASFATASVSQKSLRVGDNEIQYKVVLPDNYDASKAYPAILAFGGGPQTMRTVDGILERNFQPEAERRGYIVIAPAANENGDLFFQGGERVIPDLVKTVLKDYKIADNKFHIAGISNGGISAMHIAGMYPQYFISATALPGYMWEPSEKKLIAIENLCVYLYVGENDEYRWHDEMKSEVDFLAARGTVAKYSVEKDQPHRIETLAGASASRLFDNFDATKQGCKH
jgi:poly(3-hydroxybutyrate) depolymerase